MNFTDIIKEYGSVEKASIALGYTRVTLYNWRDNGIGHRAQLVVESKSGGKLKANSARKTGARA